MSVPELAGWMHNRLAPEGEPRAASFPECVAAGLSAVVVRLHTHVATDDRKRPSAARSPAPGGNSPRQNEKTIDNGIGFKKFIY
jgi:hypothetical protein